MKNKKKNKWGPIIAILFIVGIVIAAYSIFNYTLNDKKFSLSLSEKRWIEKNKNNVIDIAVINNLPIFGNEGNGIFFSFIQDFEKDTELEFNKISYTINGNKPEVKYAFNVLTGNDKVKEKDLLFYEDNYVIVSKEDKKINNINNMGNAAIGLLSNDIAAVSSYLSNNNNLTYTPVNDINTLISSFNDNKYNYIVIPKNVYLKIIIENNYYINYLFNDLSKKYVLTLNSNSNLNSILTKYYKVWVNNNLNNQYNHELFNLYCSMKNIDDNAQTVFQGKRYVYGYVKNLPYETVEDGNFLGVNSQFINGFSQFSSTEFMYKSYSSVEELNKALKDGRVDMAFNYYQFKNIDDKLYYTVSPFYSDYVILSNLKNDMVIDSVKGLKDKKIATLKNTVLTNYAVKNFNAEIRQYNKINQLLGDNDQLILLDKYTYEYYQKTKLTNYRIIYEDKADVNYNFVISKTSDNQLFYNIFQYYLSGLNHEMYKAIGMNNILLDNKTLDLSLLWLYLILIIILLAIMSILFKKRKKIRKIRNDNKTKYIDPLTSLKNRYYLSVHMQKWEENTIYPQAIIIVDLNNLKDINDSYGHDEGDNVIKMAANILINNQLENTDIVRTDGNEFTIYMVGYDEVQVVAYMRKLYRLFKDLPYERGASLGYSMIEDDIKTIDDAINEAVLDMVTNKETNRDSE